MTIPASAIKAVVVACALAVGFVSKKRTGRAAWAERGLLFLTRIGPPALVAFCLTLALSAFLSYLRPPSPLVHDEYSYLLAADTFASGRLTNPPHPFWKHFETMHVLVQPTYQSRYPPGQGLVLALGKVLTGHYIVGVWLSMAAAAAVLYWALAAWLPRHWAMLGALLPVIQFGISASAGTPSFAYWETTYWGGGAALAGGAMVFGAAPRLLRRPHTRDAVVFALGLAALAITRPYEGLVVSAPLSLIGLVGVWRSRAWGVIVPTAATLTGLAAFLLLYNHAVTGSAFRFPYNEYSKQYATTPNFRFQQLRPQPEYRHDVIRRFNTEWMMKEYRMQEGGLGLSWKEEGVELVTFYFGLPLAPILLLGLFWRSRWRTLCVVLFVLALASHAITTIGTLRAHYLAPFAPALLLMLVQGLRVLKVSLRRNGALGCIAAQAVLVMICYVFVEAAVREPVTPLSYKGLEQEREAVVAALQPPGARHLVFVRYGPAHGYHREWVYNAADIDASRVVWAREMSREEDEALRAYFSDRYCWIVFADEDPPRIEKCPDR